MLTKEPKANIFSMPGSIVGVRISPNGRFVALAWGPSYQFARIRLIDLESGRMCRELTHEGAWPVVLTDERMIYGSAESPLTVTIEPIHGDGAKTELELNGVHLEQMTVSASGRFLICLSFESHSKSKTPPTPITVHDEKTGRSFLMPGIDLPPRTPFEARHGQFDSFAFATVFDLSNYTLVWQECIGANRARHVELREGDGTLVVEWSSGDKHWKTEHVISSVVIASANTAASASLLRFSLESSGEFTAVRDRDVDRIVGWWPSRFKVFAVSRDGQTWVGAAESSSFANAFRIDFSGE